MESGKLKIPIWFFSCESFLKQGFLDYNYDQPEVAALIDRTEAICKAQEPGHWDGYFSDTKSGNAKKALVKDLTAYGDPMPESYKDNSKEADRKLVKEHNRLLGGGKPRSLWTVDDLEKERVQTLATTSGVHILDTKILIIVVGSIAVAIGCIVVVSRYLKNKKRK
jgi:hypothetical protein